MIELPKVCSKPVTKNPQFMIIFSKPKSGKTTSFSLLENNLIIDLENGSDFVGGMTLKASSTAELSEIKNALLKAKEEGFMYDYITIDTATALEDMVNDLAIKLYQNTPMGVNFGKKPGENDIKKLPQGAGYQYLREAFMMVIDGLRPLAKKCLILSGHVADKMVNKNGEEVSEMTLDLSGKLGRIIYSRADAVGLLYRKNNQCFVNFNGGGDAIIEARPEHLAGKEFMLTEKTPEGIVAHWDSIFIKE
jgi:hypothetical protein